MPCNSAYMEPNWAEKNSKETAECLRYTLLSLSRPVGEMVDLAADNVYGDVANLDRMVVMLCHACKDMTEEEQERIIFDGRSAAARKLAGWWQIHQAADKKRLETQADRNRQRDLRASARKKLTDEELDALGDKGE